MDVSKSNLLVELGPPIGILIAKSNLLVELGPFSGLNIAKSNLLVEYNPPALAIFRRRQNLIINQ